ncbi:MAG: endonuclease/exonuclease/phosphatase family protein, partial [Henriciella sp.]|uniref:hypothetical protein n=1 Tax=Henriciella sp. TaxID=1968823 RepID=UPI003C7276C3
EQWRDLKKRYPSAVLCVAGDYNTDMGSGRIYGTKRGIEMLNEAFDELDLVCATAPNLMPAGMLARPPIDHVAVSRRTGITIKVVDAFEGKVGSPRLSDHSAVVVEIF